jgi:quercetin dioxygenase-like cupin family protein
MTIDNASTTLTHVGSGRGRALDVLSEAVEVKLGGADTGGAYALFEIYCPPGGGFAPLHTHPPQETFYVLEGEFEFYGTGPDGPCATAAAAGSAVHVPAGAPHGYKNVGGAPGRLLAIFEPPGRMQELFEALDRAPAPEQLGEILAEHDIVVLP